MNWFVLVRLMTLFVCNIFRLFISHFKSHSLSTGLVPSRWQSKLKTKLFHELSSLALELYWTTA